MLNDKTSSKAANGQPQVRAAYQTPSLRVYGDVRSLTEAGAGSVAEGMAMISMMKFP